MVTIATVCQSKLSLMLLLDGLCIGAKTISVQLKEKKFIPEWKTTLTDVSKSSPICRDYWGTCLRMIFYSIFL